MASGDGTSEESVGSRVGRVRGLIEYLKATRARVAFPFGGGWPLNSGFQSRLRELNERIARAAERARRDPSGVKLVAVTKTVPADRIREAYEAGLRDFGENRVQEALPKQAMLPEDVRWHLIGRLQSNKINKVMGRFVLIQSVDSLELARQMSQRRSTTPQEILIEVNTSGETTKAGLAPGETVRIVREMALLPGLELRGLMTIGPLTGEIQARRAAFQNLRELYETIRRASGMPGRFDILSMGMSGDFEEAIEEGSTLIRVGTALFGERA